MQDPERIAHYDPDSGEWDGQLANPELVAQVPPAKYSERKAGGPKDRLGWLIANASAVNAGAFRLLSILVNDANHAGLCYPSWARLKELSGTAYNMTIARQLDELKAAGLVEIVRHGKGTRTVNTYRLTGHYTDWESSSPQATTEEGLSSSPQATRVVAPRLQGLSPPGYLTSSPQATGNPPFNPGLNPPHPSGVGVLNPRLNQPTATGLRPGGLVESPRKLTDEDRASIQAAAAAQAVKLQEAAEAKAAADKAEFEAIWPCATCGERWTTKSGRGVAEELANHRKHVQRQRPDFTQETLCDACRMRATAAVLVGV